MREIKIKKDKAVNMYVAVYKTLDIAAQGKTKEAALIELCELIITHIEYAIENNNMDYILPPKLKQKMEKRRKAERKRLREKFAKWKRRQEENL